MGGVAACGSYPVWYAHYDESPSFADWRSFGVWTRLAIKQFNDSPDPAICGAKSERHCQRTASARTHTRRRLATQPASQPDERTHAQPVLHVPLSLLCPSLFDSPRSIDHNWYASIQSTGSSCINNPVAVTVSIVSPPFLSSHSGSARTTTTSARRPRGAELSGGKSSRCRNAAGRAMELAVSSFQPVSFLFPAVHSTSTRLSPPLFPRLSTSNSSSSDDAPSRSQPRANQPNSFVVSRVCRCLSPYKSTATGDFTKSSQARSFEGGGHADVTSQRRCITRFQN